MGSLLTDAKNDAASIVSELADGIPSSRRPSVCDRRLPRLRRGWLPVLTHCTANYPYQLDRSFTGATPTGGISSVESAISALSLGNGGDLPEAYFGSLQETQSFRGRSVPRGSYHARRSDRSRQPAGEHVPALPEQSDVRRQQPRSGRRRHSPFRRIGGPDTRERACLALIRHLPNHLRGRRLGPSRAL